MAQTEMFMNLYYAINSSMVANGKQNMVIFVVDKYNDIPAWIYLNNPNIRTFLLKAQTEKLVENIWSLQLSLIDTRGLRN